MKLEHIFFDLDHTLWDFEKNSALTFEQIFNEYAINISINDFLDKYTPINLNYWKLYREEKISKDNLRFGRLKDTFNALNIAIENNLIHKLSEAYIHTLPNYNFLFDGAIELLNFLKEKYQLHIITNGFEEVQNLKMEKSNIKKYFNNIITSESVGVKKPNPKIFEYALKTSKAKPSNSLMIGDNLEADIIGAINCKINTIYITTENHKFAHQNCICVRSLIEIKQYL